MTSTKIEPGVRRALVRWVLPALGGLLFFAIAVILLVDDVEVRFTEDEVRQRIEAALPLEAGDTVALEIETADIAFLGDTENGRVALRAEGTAKGFGLGGTVEADTTTAIAYADGAFYLSDLRPEDVVLTPSRASKVKLAALKAGASRFLDDLKIEMTDDEVASFDALLADLKAEITPLALTALEDALRTVPVYDLSRGGAGQRAAALVLKDLRFEDGAVVAVLSPAQAVAKIATGVLIALILGIAAVLVFHDAAERARTDP